MQYLLQTHKGVFLVQAKDYNEACKLARLSGVADADKCISMLGAFGNPVRHAAQLQHTGIVIVTPDLLKKAIEKYTDARVADSWKGGGDVESIPEIESELTQAVSLLKNLTGLTFEGV